MVDSCRCDELTMKAQKKQFSRISLAALVGCGILAQSQVIADGNSDLQDEINGYIFAHNLALPTSLTPAPGISDVAEAVTYTTNIALKYIQAPFNSPGDKGVLPNSADNCTYSFTMPQAEADYSNLLGIWDTQPLPASWGALGAPSVSHANTDVVVGVKSLNTNALKMKPTSQYVTLPAGNHTMQWQATTQVSALFDYILPVVVYGLTNIKYGKAAPNLLDDSAKQAAKQAKFQKAVGETLINIGIELGLIAADGLTDTGADTVTHGGFEHRQVFTVFDILNPEIDTNMPEVTIEATDFGGSYYSRNSDALFDTIIAYDPCGRDYSVTNDAPFLLPLGETTLNWTVRDRGPNESFESNFDTLQQLIRVEDTQPPIMITPPGKVLEVAGSGKDVDDILLGFPRVVDLADSNPSISNDAPEFFPVNTRTPVSWETADASGNVATGEQLITVKEIGANTAPSADDKFANTITSNPVDIVLTGSDEDFLDGRFDPLSFAISNPPDNGEFIAPLLPYFIEDYRTQPEGPFGQEFLLTNNRSNWVYSNYCQPNISIPRDWIYSPRFVEITDDGTQYVTDFYWWCNPSNSETSERISKWDKEGNYLGMINISNNTFENFVLDRDGNLYTLSSVGAGSSTDLFLNRCPTEFTPNGSGINCTGGWKFNYGSAPGINPSTLVYARVDSQLGIVYVTDKLRVYAFDIRESSNEAEFLGELLDGEIFLNSCSAAGRSRGGFTIEIDSDSNLYVADSCDDKVHKFTASVFDGDGEFVAGNYIGWLGKCSASTNNACDEEKGRTKGYSCTVQTCIFDSSDGDQQGQFNTPLHLALDPNDILYVADYGNRRVQRFTQDGTFAGEAESTGTGINMGDKPSFILGNFDSPRTVSVNSTQFFILDRDESFVHVFETSPLKDITDSSATVTYVSQFSFHSSTDTFEYIVTDGLDSSEPATVSVNVARNFRPPEAVSAEYSILEDKDLSLVLEADDPDGVIGTGDFNPLDVLTYDIRRPPAHGTLIGSGTDYEYTPDPDFNGMDSFDYVASDGVLESAPATVYIEVEPVNDPPAFEVELNEQPTVGFPLNLALTFTDDSLTTEGTSVHEVEIRWGDGTVDNQDDPDADEPVVLVVSPALEGAPGLVTAAHTYTDTGNNSIRVCITDEDGARNCETTLAVVNKRVSLAMEINPTQEDVATGEQLSYEVTVVNLEPGANITALDAENVQVSHVIPAGLSLVSMESPDIECTQSADEVSCDLGDMIPGEAKSMTLTAANETALLYDIVSEFSSVAITTSPATREFYLGFALTSLVADSTDTDGDGIYDVYEAANGLNPFADDSELDLDFDGVSNLDEFLNQTAANNMDTDNDGLGDSWELQFGLDPTDGGDALLDNDGDSFSNLDEFLADRDPLVDEATGNRLIPILSLFSDSNLFVPTTRVGADIYDLEFQLVNNDPVVFQLGAAALRDIKLEVVESAAFNTTTNQLSIPVIDVEGQLYQAELQLINAAPVQLQLLSAGAATIVP